MKVVIILFSLLVGIIFGSIFLDFVLVDRPAQQKLSNDFRNNGAKFLVHWRYWLNPSEIVIDLRSVSSASMIDIDRCLMQIAEALDNTRYSHVYLARDGEEKFRLDGEYFQRLGLEYGLQNPAYTVRTLAENIETVDGFRAFPVWTA